jgi:hypothetical protein
MCIKGTQLFVRRKRGLLPKFKCCPAVQDTGDTLDSGTTVDIKGKIHVRRVKGESVHAAGSEARINLQRSATCGLPVMPSATCLNHSYLARVGLHYNTIFAADATLTKKATLFF